MYIIVAILIFGVLIAVHELGHFLAAKLFGVRVNEFPSVWGQLSGREKREKRLTLCAFCPLAGFVPWRGKKKDLTIPER